MVVILKLTEIPLKRVLELEKICEKEFEILKRDRPELNNLQALAILCENANNVEEACIISLCAGKFLFK